MEERLHTRVGAVVLVLLVIGVGLALALANRHLRPGFVIHIEFARTGGLRVDAPVRVSGRVVGVIDGIRLLPRRGPMAAPGTPGAEPPILVLDVWIERRAAGLIRENSVVFVNQRSLGDAFLEIGPCAGEPGPIVRPGSTLRGVDAFSLDRLLRDVNTNLVEAGAVIADLLPDVLDLGRAFDELSAELDAAEPAPGTFRHLLDRGTELGELWRELDSGDVSLVRLLAAIRDARVLVDRARRELGLIEDRAGVLLDQVEALDPRFDQARRDRLERAVLGVERTLRTLDSTLANLEALVGFVDRGGGTIGALLDDAEFQDDLKAIFRMLEEQPWRAVGHP